MIGGDPLGEALLIIAPLGLVGIFVVTLFERLVPLLPSQGIFASIGVAAADGLWCLPTAMAASIVGGGSGAFAAYRLGLKIAAREPAGGPIKQILRRRDILGRYLRKTRRSTTSLPFTAQLLPGARLLAPLIAGTMLHDRRRLAIAVLAGLAVWNTTFMAAGYAMARLTGSSNATSITLAFAGLMAVLVVARPITTWIHVRLFPSL